jgi:hypothetical protein
MGAASSARAQDSDYAVSNRAWNGLSELIAIAREAKVDVQVGARIDLHGVKARDGMLVIYPQEALPRTDLTAFMYEGGRLAVADDFGTGGALLEGLGVHRHTPAPVAASQHLRGNLNVLIAKPGARHPLSENVQALVTNHPQALQHDELEAIFSLGGPRDAVVLSGAVGKGRLVAISDSSVLINNMLELRGNRSFARNLVRYLAPNGRLWVATPTTELSGHYGNLAVTDPLLGLRAGLRRLAQARLPDAAVRITTLVVAALLVLGAATALPRRSSYLRAVSMPKVEASGGFAGRVRFFSKKEANLLVPLLAYKTELESQLLEALALKGEPTLRDLVDALKHAGVEPPLVERAQGLLVELRALALAQDGPAPPRIGKDRFHAMLADGDRILAAVERPHMQSGRS